MKRPAPEGWPELILLTADRTQTHYYCQKASAAEDRHRVRNTCARAECADAIRAAETTYRQIDPAGACNEANAAFRKAVSDADKKCARDIADSTRIKDQEIDAAWAEHRSSPEYQGIAR